MNGIISSLVIIINAIFVNNIVMAQFLGCCPFLGVSKKLDTAVSMGLAVTFVMALSSVITYIIQYCLLVPLHIEYMQTVVFILVIASLVQFVEMVIQKMSPALYNALGIYLPLITTNCAVLGSAILNIQEGYNLINTLINGKTYFSYYSPVRNQDGSIVGMLFIGKSSAAVSQAIQRYVYPLTWLIIGFVALVAVCIYFYTRRFVAVLLHIHSFLSEVASGNLNATLDHSVTKRSDELGDIGRCALSMQRSLRTMIEQDALTELYNRRSGEKKLRQIFEEAQSSRHSFALAIGDIDFFKKVNDTYGHECGDAVLKNVSALLKQHMWRRGFAARWGGEEFLLVFENVDLAEARKQLELLMDKIHELDTLYEGQHVKINMTFGLVCESDKDVHTLLKEADEKLYIGKTNGRNQVVS